MRLYAVAALIAGLLMAAPAPAQPDGSWYYCDPSHAYYPYVGSCAVPWRVVPNQSRAPQAGDSTATSPSARSAPILLAPSSTASASPSSSEPQTSTFHQGQADRQSWEDWFGSLTDEKRAGADFWAARRSLPHPGSCGAAPSTGADWTTGCVAAQQRLAASDARRKTEPDYRLGWNSPPTTVASTTQPGNSNEALGIAPSGEASPSSAQAAVQTVEADNGAVYRITGINPTGFGGVDAIVYPPGAPGDFITPMQIRFDCHGHMRVHSYSYVSDPVEYIPPRSVGSGLAQVACAGIEVITRKMRMGANIRQGGPAYACGTPPQRACVPATRDDYDSNYNLKER
jgi:hypothetical protein